MADSEKRLNKYDVIVRLMELIDDFPEDQQLILFKHLTKSNFSVYLSKLIMEMPEHKRLTLLNQLEEIKLQIGRQSSRKPCKLTVDYETQDNTFKDYIQDLSTRGMFIKTRETLTVGQEILLTLALPDSDETMKISGRVVRSDDDGYGIKFENLNQYKEDIIEACLEKMEDT